MDRVAEFLKVAEVKLDSQFSISSWEEDIERSPLQFLPHL